MKLKRRKTGAYIVVSLVTFCIMKNFATLVYNGCKDCKEKRREKLKKEEKGEVINTQGEQSVESIGVNLTL